jgi:hypothetical protein
MSEASHSKKFSGIPPDLQALLRQQHRQARQAADNFVRVCREGRACQLDNAHLFLNDCDHTAWRLAMRRIARLDSVSPDVQAAFIPIWVESKMLALRVGNRPVLAKALRVLLPGAAITTPLTLYRGAGAHERRRRLYGFSWTTDAAVARTFAEHWARPIRPPYSGPAPAGVILRTVAPPEAVLLMRQPEDYYDEGEVVVDPFRLGKVTVVERLGG